MSTPSTPNTSDSPSTPGAPAPGPNTARADALSGVVPPLCTPLTPERAVDAPALERLVAFQIEAGAAALFVAGSTGEVAYLTDEQRGRTLEVVAAAAAGQVPVLAGIVDTATPRVAAHAAAAKAGGADALVATAPFYVPTHPAEIRTHFRAVRAAADLPLYAYDIPSFTHTKLDAETVVELAEEGTIDGLKDSSGDLDALRAVLELAPPGLRVFTGSEVVADLGLRIGAHGIVPGLGNVDPHGYVRLYDAARRGDWTAAEREQVRLRALFRLVKAGNPARMGPYSSAIGAFKEGLRLRGVIGAATTSLPMVALDDAERAVVREHLAAAGLPTEGDDA
ncbi:4-hydroxy-tetrahydrodipicolinate synthase [Murinocardiopsis flavida]|uniref:4-hydroxy-tetrahydrodipicolinate synthase n=1 Tax=Murinocardiopsis flavida TaxID=645275 RepID=A0A2P8DPA2_9ACTN|nr:dihydrodipicolinate synthase family protein [Murinocardiopsis flavida]PSK99029.1 4-hydroxy-tetrahydrodipicolinate synthase [Murinocardiopsis flavida]